MRKSLSLIILLLLARLAIAQQDNNYLFTSDYSDPIIRKKVTTVIVVNNDSIKIYNDHVGYLWWKVEKCEYFSLRQGSKQIMSGKWFLHRNNAISFLMVKSSKVYHVITILPEKITFTVEFTVKVFDFL